MSIIHIPGFNFCSWIIIFYQKIRSRGYHSIVLSDHTPTSLEPLLARLPRENSLIHRSLCSLIPTWNHRMKGQMISYVSTLKKAARGESEAICVLHPLLFIKNSVQI